MKYGIILAAIAAMSASAGAQPVAGRVTSGADRELLTQLVAREDSRQPYDGSDVRRQGIESSSPFIRAFTVRGLGRLEQVAAGPYIMPMLADTSAEVRAAAADALAQSVARPMGTAASANDRAATARAVDRARDALTVRLATERTPATRAMLLESLGRLPQGFVDQVKSTAALIAPSLAAADVVERRGAIRGIFFLARKGEARAAGVIPAAVTDRMYAILLEPASAGFTPTDRFNVAFALWGALALSESQSAALLADRDPYVRDRAVVALARSSELPLVRDLVAKALRDTAPVVRFRALNVYNQKLRATDGCERLIDMTRDGNMNVALAAADALAGCRGDTTVAGYLATVAGSFRDDDRWHLPTHAFVSLSAVDSARAGTLAPRFARSRNFYVRTYAATAATQMADARGLRALARDAHPNVQAAAIEGLSKIVGHGADSVYVRALRSNANQVLMAATAALKGTTMPGVRKVASDRLVERFYRATDTDVDGNHALQGLITALGGNLLTVTDIRPERIPVPSFADMASMERMTARIEMADGAVITMRLHPFDAPTNTWRFVRLARARVFDGLTFHRVAPFFVVQGPGPNANEYSAPDKPFARDELALSNVRGSVGLSTRGRDTGDGQIYVNTVDNVWLDHEYTVMATITSGLEAFDRMQEGARIRRVTISP